MANAGGFKHILLVGQGQRIEHFYLFLFLGILKGVVLSCEEKRFYQPFVSTEGSIEKRQQNAKGQRGNFANLIFLLSHSTNRLHSEAQHGQKLV